MPRNIRNVQRLNSRQSNSALSKYTLPITAIVWVLVMLDMWFIAKDSVFLMVVFSIGIWGTGIALAKPGQLAEKFREYGFWRTLIHFGHPESSVRQRKNARRNRNRNYRR